VLLADNQQFYNITITREDAGDVEEVMERLARIIPLTEDQIERAREEFAKTRRDIPVTLAERVRWEDVSRVVINAPALPGVNAKLGYSRHYPLGPDIAHVVGYVGPVSDYDLSLLETPDPLLRLPRFQIGKTMVENRLEESLRGKAGTLKVEKNAIGRVMRELDRVEGIPGTDVQLTIDARLQNYAQARLGEESASAIVIDLADGDVRAIASSPSYDPNLFVRGISVADWDLLNEREKPQNEHHRPLAAKTVQGAYPPGSTFKMITALAALEDGVIGPEETVRCVGHLDVSGTRFHCWRRGGHGNMNLHESMKQSCDVYYYDIAQRVGIDKIAEMGRRFGLGVRHELPMSAIHSGNMPDHDWAQRARGRAWRVGDTVNASIGQGDVLTSPLQLAIMTARLATGRSLSPRLVRSIGGIEQPSGAGEALDVNPNFLIRLRQSMYAVSNHARGTAYGSRIVEDRFRLAGKTGTSQVRRITPEERARGVVRNEDLPWHRRDHALFVGYAPFDDPKYAVAVVVEHGGGGAAVAAPIARDILLQALYEGTPPLDAYPSNLRSSITEQQRRLQLRDIRPGRSTDRA